MKYTGHLLLVAFVLFGICSADGTPIKIGKIINKTSFDVTFWFRLESTRFVNKPVKAGQTYSCNCTLISPHLVIPGNYVNQWWIERKGNKVALRMVGYKTQLLDEKQDAPSFDVVIHNTERGELIPHT